ncbi:MAG: DUF1329 domain-containing protein [Syntrophobacteraceae bacterium]
MSRNAIIAICLVVFYAGFAVAEITPEEAKLLGGNKFTAIGAEVAGNADGTIPAYTGGMVRDILAPGFDRKKDILPNPFADEKPLFTISAQNMDRYADKLAYSTQMLLKKFPESYRLNVYPTHRTVAIPDYIAQGTRKSALRARLENDGRDLTGTYCGFPFPFPKNGLELLWNHILRWSAPAEEFMCYRGFVVTSAGRRIMVTEGHTFSEYPYWNPNQTGVENIIWRVDDRLYAPANRNGEALMWVLFTDKSKGDPAWQYLPGQRRVKMSPEVSYDGPNTTVAGACTYDDLFMFNGSPDRFDWKIIGKKDMFVPYNQYKITFHSTEDQIFVPRHVNPDFERWELHRVWIVEGTRKPNARHIYLRRTIYLDEDSWIGLLADEYDNNNSFYRCMVSGFTWNYDTQAPFSAFHWGYDFVSGIYWVNGYLVGPNLSVTIRPESYWNPQSLSGRGVR